MVRFALSCALCASQRIVLGCAALRCVSSLSPHCASNHRLRHHHRPPPSASAPSRQCCVYGDASHAGGKRGFHRPGSATALRFAPALPALGGDEEAGGARQNAPAASAAQGEEEEAFFGGLTPAPACVVE